MSNFDPHDKTPHGLAITGRFGSGKSNLAKLAVSAACARGESVLWVRPLSFSPELDLPTGVLQLAVASYRDDLTAGEAGNAFDLIVLDSADHMGMELANASEAAEEVSKALHTRVIVTLPV